jgi:hypothetical protein
VIGSVGCRRWSVVGEPFTVHRSPFTVQGCIENPEVVLGNVELVSDMCAAHERKSPVVNARKARCQNFESNFMSGAGKRVRRRVDRDWGGTYAMDDR